MRYEPSQDLQKIYGYSSTGVKYCFRDPDTDEGSKASGLGGVGAPKGPNSAILSKRSGGIAADRAS